MAAPSVGARPITSFVYGDNKPDIYTQGGLWWTGNMKAVLYNLVAFDREQPAENRVMDLF
jgi:chitinase